MEKIVIASEEWKRELFSLFPCPPMTPILVVGWNGIESGTLGYYEVFEGAVFARINIPGQWTPRVYEMEDFGKKIFLVSERKAAEAAHLKLLWGDGKRSE